MASASQATNKTKTEKPVPADPAPVTPATLAETLQRAARETPGEQTRINVRLLIDGSDADGIRHYDEELPVSLVQAILNPSVQDFFIPIKGNGRLKPGRVKSHWLHTSYIREVLLLDELPE